MDGPAKSDKPPILDGWKPINSEMFMMVTIYQLVQDFATIHSMLRKHSHKPSILLIDDGGWNPHLKKNVNLGMVY